MYLTEEATQSLLRVSLTDLSVDTLLSFESYPTGIATDDAFVYLNLQVLVNSRYHGHLLRFGSDGSDGCELA